MNKADPLIAAFRQLAAGKMASRLGGQNATIAKDGKDKAEHFREQLRSIAQGAKPGAKAEIKHADTDATKGLEIPDRIAEVIEEVTTRPKERGNPPSEIPPQQVAADVTTLPLEWRGPEAALSAVISRLDQAQTSPRRDDAVTPRVAHTESRPERPEMSLKDDVEVELKAGDAVEGPKSDAPPEQRIALSVNATETRTLPPVKVVVREQETHFEPVQQVTLLQKIVDRMATDLQAASPQAGPGSPDTALPMPRVADKPVRILTLQLDPPDLGAVIVKMRLIGDAVEVRLSADRYETTQMLQQERGALTDVMQSAGYAFDIASIDHSRASDANPGAGQQQAQPEQRQSQQLHGGSQIDNATSERQSSDTQAGSRQGRRQHDQFTEPVERHQEQEVVRNRTGGALYL
jgi:chemotaxis protein MotD